MYKLCITRFALSAHEYSRVQGTPRVGLIVSRRVHTHTHTNTHTHIEYIQLFACAGYAACRPYCEPARPQSARKPLAASYYCSF